MKELALLTAFGLLWNANIVRVQETAITVHAEHVTNRITPYMTGACMEDVNHQVYGGIYSQMVFGESFQEPERQADGVSGMWRSVIRGEVRGEFALEPDDAFVGRQSQRIALQNGQGEFGIENRGLNRCGMFFVKEKPYEGCLWARSEKPTDLYVALESGDGARTYAETRLQCIPADWQRLDFEVTPADTDTSGRLAITLRQPGAVVLGYAFLQPGAWGRFKDLPVRKDVAEGLLAQGLTVLRYGGSMTNAEEYRWKKMIGPRDRRPPYKGAWYPYSTNGWGIVEFISFCAAAGFLPIPAFNMNETPQDMADFVEYVNGSKDTAWGRKRAEDGRAEPYGLKHIELGNEERIDERYWRRFKPLAEAIWDKDPSITVIVGDFGHAGEIRDPFDFVGNLSGIRTLAVHQKILELAKSHGRPVWFDIHVANTEPHQPDMSPVRSFIEALSAICPGADYQVCVLEENAGNHSVRRALGHAHTITALERLGNRVPIVCAANCLQPYKQNDNGWDQGMLFLTPSQVWGQPPYYVTQMISRNYMPLCVEAACEDPADALDVTAKKSEDGAVLTLQVVNMIDRPIPAAIRINGFAPSKSSAKLMQLTGGLDDVNTPENPEKIVPQQSEWTQHINDRAAAYVFPPYSFTLFRFE